MAGIADITGILGKPRSGLGAALFQQILRDALKPPEDKTSNILGQKIDLNTITPEQGAQLTSQLEDAQTDTGFSGVQEAFDVLDIPGAFVRGLVGAGVSAAKGEFGQAGERLLSALPGSENIPKLLGEKGIRAPEGSELLEDFGFERGTTTDDEWRMRIARAAGASDVEQFATKGKPLGFEKQRAFDALLKKAGEILPADELGPGFADAKNATDAQDFAGIGLEIALDPLTYFTFGASAAGKVARLAATAEKAGGKGFIAALNGAGTLADARKIVQGLDVAGFGPNAKQRLLGSLEDAFKSGKPDFDLGRTMAEQSGRGQLQAGFKLPFAKEPFIDLPTQGTADVLSTLGQSKLAESVFGDVPFGVNERVHEFLTETPVVAQVTGILRGVIEGGRKLTGRSGIPALDELIKSGKALAGEGTAAGTRELNKLNAAMRDTAKAAGVDLDVVRATVGEAVELAGKDSADFAATLSRTGLKESEIAPIAAGFTKINEMLAKKADQFNLPLNELDDESLNYLHRMLTGPGREWVRKNSKKVKDLSGGAEFSARSGMFKGRIDKWRGKTIKQINEEMSEAMGGAKFFTEDPFAATTHAVSEMHRRIGNAYTATKIVEQFGSEAVKGSDFTAAKLYEKIGLRVDDARPITGYKTVERALDDVATETASAEGRGRYSSLPERQRNALDAFDDGARGDPLSPDFISADQVNVRPRGIANVPGLPGVSQSQTLHKWGKEIAAARASGTPLTRHQQRVVNAIEKLRKQGLPTPPPPKARVSVSERVPVYGDSEAEKLAKIAVPEELFDATVSALETQKSPGKFLNFYHGVTNWLKATVTTLFPAFHGRNMLENTFKGFIEGNRDPRNLKDAVLILAAAQDLNAGGAGIFDAMARGARSSFAKAGKPNAEVMKLLKEETGFDNLEDFAAWAAGNGLFENKFTSEFGVDMRQALLGKDPNAAQKAAAGFGGLFGALQRAGFAVASGTENMHRLSFFLDRLRKGHGRDGALNEVKRVFFDYRDMGKLESSLAKNLGFFYNFARNNLRYMVQTAGRHPVYTKQINRLFFEDPDNPRHSWLSDKGSFRIGGIDVSLGFLPQQQFNMFSLAEGDVWDKMAGKLGQTVGQMNPIIESGLSAAFGKDLYRNLPLEYVDRAPDWSFAPEWVKTMIGLRETVSSGYVMSPKWRWLMDTVPALGRFAQSQISAESDRAYWSTFAQLLSGVRIQNREPTKDALALMQRNIDRSAGGMEDLRRGAFGEWVTDRRTSEGRIKSALTKQSPDKQDLIFLASEPQIMARLAPYVTLDKDGQPVMNRLLRTKMLEMGTELYPRHAALMQAQQAQRAAQIRAMSPKEQEAQAAFEAMFGG